MVVSRLSTLIEPVAAPAIKLKEQFIISNR
jgi:hypothetical protein